MSLSSKRYAFWVAALLFAVALLYLILYLVSGQLSFEPTRDEKHFWRTTKQFAKDFPPPIELLRGYNELNTPLPFVVFGAVERFTGGGIAAGRLVNLLMSFGIVLLIIIDAWRSQPFSRRHFVHIALACVGLLAFPYFLGTSVMLYTDILPAAFVLGGMVLHMRGSPWVAMPTFVLAISSRQYAVAFPFALLIHELAKRVFRPKRSLENHLSGDLPAGMNESRAKVSMWLAPAVSVLSLLGWVALFGGLAPRAAVEDQHLATASALRIFPAHALYFLACVGAYYVIPETILFWNLRPLTSGLRKRASFVLAAAVIIAFCVWPPLRNVDYGVPTMGYLDKAARMMLGDIPRMILFAALAVLAVGRFSQFNLASVLVWTNALLMMKAHIGWDKYALPLLVVLWWMKPRGETTIVR